VSAANRTSAKVRRYWTLPELRRLEQLYCWQDSPIADVAEALGRTRMSVKVMAQKLGLHRSTRFMASGVPRWTAGNRPWNVGKQAGRPEVGLPSPVSPKATGALVHGQ
jgi:hypothetical protein